MGRPVFPSLVWLALFDTGCPDSWSDPCGSCGAQCVLEAIPSPGAEHVEGEVVYDVLPPTGGAHHECWAEWGVHTEEVADEAWVHNLEHGGVAFLYNCPDGCPEDVATLTQLVEGLPVLALLSPYAAMESRFAATAWGYRLLLECADVDALGAFYEDHVGHAPEYEIGGPPDDCG